MRWGRLDRLAHLALACAFQIVKPIGNVGDGDRWGIVLGTAFGSHLSNELFQSGIMEQGREMASPSIFIYTLPSAATAEISIHLGMRGPALTLAQGMGSGLSAIFTGVQLLQNRRIENVLTLAADTLSATLLRSPLGQHGILAEGAAGFILCKEKDRALARVAGFGQAFGPHAASSALRGALETARLNGRDVKTWIEGTKTGYPACLGNSLASAPLMATMLAIEEHAPFPMITLSSEAEHGALALCLTET